MASIPAEYGQLVALFKAGCHVELERRAHELIAQCPADGLAWKLLGASLQAQGKDALMSLTKAATLLPDDAGTHFNLGMALQDLGKLDEASASFRRALAINPDYAAAHFRLGNAQLDLGQLENAVMSLRQTLALQPNNAEAHINLGYALKDLGEIAGAVASFRRATELRPEYARAHNNLGNALKDLGHLNEAVTSFHRALAIKPDYANAHYNLGNALLELGQYGDAVASYRQALAYHAEDAEAHSNLLFAHNYLADIPAATLLTDARQFGAMVTRQAQPYAFWPNSPEPGRVLRVGLVSGDFRSHPVGYFLESVLEALASHAAGSLALYAYSNHFSTDTHTTRLKACCQDWRCVAGLADESLARQIRDDGIDILIDLSGHSALGRLPMFAWKPAPLQLSWLGYFATTGVAQIDYLIADPYTLPASDDAHFTETIWRLPETRLCFTPPALDIPVGPLPALKSGYITFGCFNNLPKLNDTVVAVWSNILNAVPSSRLFLKTKQLADAGVRDATSARFAARGIDTARLILEGPSSRADYLAAYQRVDLALDPFPFPGGTTSVEGLWMGVPVLSLAGERFLSRQGVGILMNAGLPDWIAADADNYVAKAIAHARDIPRLAALRANLRQTVLASPLCDAPRFAGHFAAALRAMWERWCRLQQQ